MNRNLMHQLNQLNFVQYICVYDFLFDYIKIYDLFLFSLYKNSKGRKN